MGRSANNNIHLVSGSLPGITEMFYPSLPYDVWRVGTQLILVSNDEDMYFFHTSRFQLKSFTFPTTFSEPTPKPSPSEEKLQAMVLITREGKFKMPKNWTVFTPFRFCTWIILWPHSGTWEIREKYIRFWAISFSFVDVGNWNTFRSVPSIFLFNHWILDWE